MKLLRILQAVLLDGIPLTTILPGAQAQEAFKTHGAAAPALAALGFHYPIHPLGIPKVDPRGDRCGQATVSRPTLAAGHPDDSTTGILSRRPGRLRPLLLVPARLFTGAGLRAPAKCKETKKNPPNWL